MNRAYRAGKINLSALLAQDNPKIDLKLDVYEASTRNFLKAVSNYSTRAMTEISHRRDVYNAEQKRIAERIQAMESEINQCKLNEIELMATLEEEQQETKESEAYAAQLKKQLEEARSQLAETEAEIERYRAIADSLRREKEKESAILHEYDSYAAPFLEACEMCLRCYIEGVQENQLLIRFTYIDESDPEREFSLVLDLSSQSYRILTSTPALPKAPLLLQELNDSRDVYTFIKRIRQAFEGLLYPPTTQPV